MLEKKNSPREGWAQSGRGVSETPNHKKTSPTIVGTPHHFLQSIFEKNRQEENKQHFAETIVINKKGHLTQKIMEKILNGEDADTTFYKLNQSELWANGNLKLTNGNLDNTLDKMLINSKILGEICEINNGIHTQADYLSAKKFEERSNLNKKIGNGIYVLSKDLEEDNLVKTSFSEIEVKNHIKPFYKNSDIHKYITNLETEREIIYLDKAKHNLENLPNIKKHLLDFENLIKKASDNAPYLHRPKKIEFELPKIVAPQRSKTNTFGYNEVPWYASADVYFITQPRENYNLKFLLGVLNSKLIYKWLYNRGKRKGEMLELYQEPLSRIPIPLLDTPEKCEIAGRIEVLVEEILLIKQKGESEEQKSTPSGLQPATPQEGNLGDTIYLETQIDELVFELYGLTREEIAVVAK